MESEKAGWSDSSDLVDVLDVRPVAEDRFAGVARADPRRPVVEGSQILAQTIVAAGRHSEGRRIVSAHMLFARPADANQPLLFDLDELSSGRTFTALGVQVCQGPKRCAAGTLLLDATAADVIRHSSPLPDVVGPADAEPYDMGLAGREVRVVGGAYSDEPVAPVGPPVIDAWVRFDDVPDDRSIHAGLLAHFTGHMSIAAALRPHAGIGQSEAHRTLSTAVNAIAISFHGDFRADRWMLYHHRSTFAGDGMTHSECSVYDEDARLLASFYVDAMVRRFERKPPGSDERTAL
jgi:acyl-CoA thioesterase II